MNRNLKFISWTALLFIFAACNSSSNSSSGGSGGSGSTALGITPGVEWQLQKMTCNGYDITNLVASGSKKMYLSINDGSIISRRATATCSQSYQMISEIRGNTLFIAKGSQYTTTCSPTSCTDSGLSSTSVCGMISVQASDYSLEVTQVTNSTLEIREDDADVKILCSALGQSTPVYMTYVK